VASFLRHLGQKPSKYRFDLHIDSVRDVPVHEESSVVCRIYKSNRSGTDLATRPAKPRPDGFVRIDDGGRDRRELKRMMMMDVFDVPGEQSMILTILHCGQIIIVLISPAALQACWAQKLSFYSTLFSNPSTQELYAKMFTIEVVQDSCIKVGSASFDEKRLARYLSLTRVRPFREQTEKKRLASGLLK
jgi:hypothetical protein